MVTLIVLGTAQDGGVPQLGCWHRYCARARRDPSFARTVACLGLVDESAQRTYLIDATPDIRAQLDYLSAKVGWSRTKHNPVDGLILTHAHVGHYAGLIHFGKEVMASSQVLTYASACMIEYLMQNGPWSALIRDGHLLPCELEPGQVVQLTERLAIRPLAVPHRDEWADTLGIEIIGPNRRVLYIPDIDGWSEWEYDVRQVVARCDLALLDGCFYSGDELPGRDMSKVPHPPIRDSLTLLAEQAVKVYFTHLNHTNPAIDPDSPERHTIEAAGFHVAAERAEFEL